MSERRAAEGSGMLAIGELSRRTGVKATTIRFYEAEGLLPPALRSEGGHRVFGLAHLRRLGFIRHARELGFEMEDLRTLLELSDRPDGSCGPVDEIAGRHLAAVEDKIAKLTALKGELARMLKSCSHGAVAECRVIEALADHSHCGGEH